MKEVDNLESIKEEWVCETGSDHQPLSDSQQKNCEYFVDSLFEEAQKVGAKCLSPTEQKKQVRVHKSFPLLMFLKYGPLEVRTVFVLISSVQLCPTVCDPINHSTPGFPVHHQLLEFTQTHVHRVCDAIQPSHPLSSPSPPAPNPSQHQSLF